MQKFKNIITLLILVSFPFICIGQQQATGFKPLSNKQAFMDAYKKACANINSYQADFVQEKTITMMKNPLTSGGKMYLRKDGKVKIEYTWPYQYVFIMNGTKVVMKDGEKEANSVAMGNNKLFKQISEITLSGINGNIFENKNFATRVLENSASYMVEATPLAKEMKEYYRKFELYFKKNSYQVEKIVMMETSGDVSVMTFKQVILNKTLSDAVFEVR